MRNFTLLISATCFLSIFFFNEAIVAQAEKTEKSDRLVLDTAKSTVNFEFAFTLGKVRGEARLNDFAFDKELINTEPLAPIGKLSVDVASMKTGDDERDCHVKESLMLDYSQSKFPDEHICTAEDEIRDDQRGAIKFETVSFEISKIEIEPDWQALVAAGKPAKALASGAWNIRGAQKTDAIELVLSKTGESPSKLTAVGATKMDFSDFGIIVKEANLLLFKIRVKSPITVSLKLLFSEI